MPSLTDLDRAVKGLEETVYGNGHKGLTTRVASLEESRLSSKEYRALLVSPFVSALVLLIGQAILKKLGVM